MSQQKQQQEELHIKRQEDLQPEQQKCEVAEMEEMHPPRSSSLKKWEEDEVEKGEKNTKKEKRAG